MAFDRDGTIRRALPYILLLAFGLGGVLVAGAHLSNAFPSERAPFGWPGPSNLERGVAMVRSDLVLAASIPTLLLGARALAGRAPGQDPPSMLLTLFATHAGLIALGVAGATGIGAWGAASAPFDAALAFWTAHTVLALSFYALAFLVSCFLRDHAVAAAAAIWLGFVALHEAITRTILFRTQGYHALASGAFPDWFWAAQASSPLASYTGILILWRPKFRDYLETEALKSAVLPAWLVPGTFVVLALLLWVLLPLALGVVAWVWRARGRRGALGVRRVTRA